MALALSYLKLSLGRYKEGWAEYEVRFQLKAYNPIMQTTLPTWRGEKPEPGDNLLVYAEQGYGDTLQFSRFLPLLLKYFSKVRFVTFPPLKRLMQLSFPSIDVVSMDHPDIQKGFNKTCSLMSLALVLNIDDESKIPNANYLKALYTLQSTSHRPEEAHIQGLPSLSHFPHKPKVGIIWAGTSDATYAKRRDLPLHHLQTLLRKYEAHWVSLQYPVDRERLSLLEQEFSIQNPMFSVNDFADTAAIIQELDLLITIETATAHLAAALGKPVWLLKRFDSDWRWLVDRKDSPWYPNIKIFSQAKTGDWESCLATLPQTL